jgi:hypothetical protein
MKVLKSLKVPNNNIDYDALFAQVDAMKFKRKDKIANVKNSIIITLNMIQYPEYRRVKELKNHYYTILSFDEMIKIFSKEGWSLVQKILLENKIIICDNSYENGVDSQGFMLQFSKLGPGSRYLNLEEVGSVFKNYTKFLASLSVRTLPNNVEHLLNEFNNLDLRLDPSVFEFVALYRDSLFERYTNIEEDDLYYYLIHYRVGEYLSMIDDFNKKKYNPFISPSNHRFYSIINTFKKELRYFIRNGRNKFNEYDLKASYNYVLATMINNRYFNCTNTITNTYNISSLFKKLSNKLYNKYKVNNNITYMSPTYFENEDIIRYRELPFEEGLFEYVIDKIFNDPEFNHLNGITRDYIKNQFKLYFNLDDSIIRRGKSLDKNSESNYQGLDIVRFMAKYFPSINRIIDDLIYKKNIKSPLSILLQRSEAYLVQQVVAKKIKEKHPDQLIFSIHDSLLIEEGECDPEKLVILFKDTLEDFTGIRPGVSNKTINPINLIDSIIDEDFNEILSNKNVPKISLLDKNGKAKIYRSLKFMNQDIKIYKAECRKFKAFIDS